MRGNFFLVVELSMQPGLDGQAPKDRWGWVLLPVPNTIHAVVLPADLGGHSLVTRPLQIGTVGTHPIGIFMEIKGKTLSCHLYMSL